jgi:hypothetical protein
MMTPLTSTLRCPKCPAANRPGATYIETDGSRAFCIVCSHAGPIETFQPKKD